MFRLLSLGRSHQDLSGFGVSPALRPSIPPCHLEDDGGTQNGVKHGSSALPLRLAPIKLDVTNTDEIRETIRDANALQRIHEHRLGLPTHD